MRIGKYNSRHLFSIRSKQSHARGIGSNFWKKLLAADRAGRVGVLPTEQSASSALETPANQ
jgi:hypothetical protein